METTQHVQPDGRVVQVWRAMQGGAWCWALFASPGALRNGAEEVAYGRGLPTAAAALEAGAGYANGSNPGADMKANCTHKVTEALPMVAAVVEARVAQLKAHGCQGVRARWPMTAAGRYVEVKYTYRGSNHPPRK